MAFKKRKGQISPNYKKYKGDIEVKPCKLYNSNGACLMVGAADGEIIEDKDGNAIPWGQIDFNIPS